MNWKSSSVKLNASLESHKLEKTNKPQQPVQDEYQEEVDMVINNTK
jgi:hypothetical protein